MLCIDKKYPDHHAVLKRKVRKTLTFDQINYTLGIIYDHLRDIHHLFTHECIPYNMKKNDIFNIIIALKENKTDGKEIKGELKKLVDDIAKSTSYSYIKQRINNMLT